MAVVEFLLGPNGEIQIAVKDGTYAQGAEIIEAAKAAFGAAGVAVTPTSDIEQHRPDQEHQHIYESHSHSH
jgi:hypothetical protein